MDEPSIKRGLPSYAAVAEQRRDSLIPILEGLARANLTQPWKLLPCDDEHIIGLRAGSHLSLQNSTFRLELQRLLS